MNRGELEQLADLVVDNLRRRRLRGGGADMSEGRGGDLTADRPIGRSVAPLRWEVPDIGWRMPVLASAAQVGPPLPRPADPPIRRSAEAAVRVADYIDHTLLKAEATRREIETLCDEAAEHEFAAVCVNGSWVPLCRRRLVGTGVKVATVVGFPLGATATRAKVGEARYLVDEGADELDMVAAVGRIADGDWDYVEDDVRAVVEAARARTVKVILETAALEPVQILQASALAMEAGAHFVKTSTGFHPAGGATPEAVALMRLAVGTRLGVKAAGGIRDCASALRMIAAGATRIGTSSGGRFVDCLGRTSAPLGELLADTDGHEAGCRVVGCY